MRFMRNGRALVDDLNISDEELGARLREFIVEADHGSWDGVPYRDLRAYSRFMDDLARWVYGSQPTETEQQQMNSLMRRLMSQEPTPAAARPTKTLPDGRVFVEISADCWRERGDEGDTTRNTTLAELEQMWHIAFDKQPRIYPE